MSTQRPNRRAVALAVVLGIALGAIPLLATPRLVDIPMWIFGGLSGGLMIWVVHRAFVVSRSPPDPLLTEALQSVSPIERWLWRDVIRRNLSKPGTRLSRMIPKYGLRSATQSVVGNVWLIPFFLLLPSVPLRDTHRFGTSGRVVGLIFLWIALVSMVFSFYRFIGSLRAGHRYRREHGARS